MKTACHFQEICLAHRGGTLGRFIAHDRQRQAPLDALVNFFRCKYSNRESLFLALYDRDNLPREISLDRPGSGVTGGNRIHNEGSAGNRIAAGKNARDICS